MQRLAHKLARLQGEPLRGLARVLDELAGVLIPHILVEERFLFPAMTATPRDRAFLRSELADTADEHALIVRLLDRVREQAATCEVRDASRMLAARLAWLDADTREHLAIEEQVLLPRFDLAAP